MSNFAIVLVIPPIPTFPVLLGIPFAGETNKVGLLLLKPIINEFTTVFSKKGVPPPMTIELAALAFTACPNAKLALPVAQELMPQAKEAYPIPCVLIPIP